MQKKIVKNGKTAVLVARNQNEQWYTKHCVDALLFDPIVVDIVLRSDNTFKILDYINSAYPDLVLDTVPILEVKWIPDGSIFKVETMNNIETLILMEDKKWIIA